MDRDDSRWVDADAGPVARPYMLTGGRTKPQGQLRFDLIDFVVRTSRPAEGYPYTPERGQLLQLCQQPMTVADLAAKTKIPLGLVRVLLADLVTDGLVRAPFDGVVDQKNISPGEWVSPGKALFTLVADDPLKIQLNVPERAVAKIQKDMRVEVSSVAVPGKSFGATVTRLGAEIGQSRALVVEATLDKGTPLIPGMFAEARVVIGQSNQCLQ